MIINIFNSKLDITSIEFSKYKLKPINTLNAKSKSINYKEGYLLKIVFKNFGIGYSDYFIWENFGDISLISQIELLKKGINNVHILKSIYFASIDAKYRAINKNIFNNIILPKNHFTCVNYNELNFNFIEKLKSDGFSIIKLKCGISINEEISFINKISPILKNNNMSLRLDFNLCLSFDEYINFLSMIDLNIENINFIEDPIEHNYNNWKKIKNIYSNIKLAADKINNKFLIECISKNKKLKILDYLVVKPAVQDIRIFSNNKFNIKKNEIIFTSYMDHPIGQLSALYEAALFYKINFQNTQDCGFITHTLYEKNSYSEALSIVDAKLIPSLDGTGFGYNNLLENENWKRIL